MKSNLDQWAGALKSLSDVLAEITLVTDLNANDKRRMVSLCISIAATAASFKELVEKK